MSIKITWKQVLSVLRNVGSLSAIVIGAANIGGLSPGVRAALVSVGGVLQVIDHAIQAPASPGTVANPTTPVKGV